MITASYILLTKQEHLGAKVLFALRDFSHGVAAVYGNKREDLVPMFLCSHSVKFTRMWHKIIFSIISVLSVSAKS